ncbi:uncharacterized protein LOC133743643 [Rosa rugosa]|uniref:uncharacterized protein LOC133743643 n=1 Tax=Rosa rugosa TaxID=74645 RepID=UPI002B4122D0|nr:uncharacterized protein LOC133743643 [Rosa rugosa]
MAAMNKDFPSLLLLCILFFKRMEYYMLERCINCRSFHNELDILNPRGYIRSFIALPHPGLALYRACIELESNLASISDKDSLVNARKLYESALKTYDQDLSLWRDYYLMETKMGTSETASAVHWHAHKILKDTTALVTPDL